MVHRAIDALAYRCTTWYFSLLWRIIVPHAILVHVKQNFFPLFVKQFQIGISCRLSSVIFINIYKFIIKFFNYLSTGSLYSTESRELYNELIHEETVLLECTNKMESSEKTMATLISKLKEAIKQEVTNYSPQW